MEKIFKLLKLGTRILTWLTPGSIQAKIAAEIAIWAIESMKKNKKSAVTNKFADITIEGIKKYNTKKVKKSLDKTSDTL